jgi:hypothetical protein
MTTLEQQVVVNTQAMLAAKAAQQATAVIDTVSEIPQVGTTSGEAEEIPQAEVVADNLPLTAEPEKESRESAEYENERTEHWIKFYKKHSGTLPVPLTHPQIMDMVWKSVDTDVENFKASLYQIVGCERKPLKDTVLIFRTEKDADDIRSLGFDAISAVKGSGNVPFKTAVTMLKMKYKRIVMFGQCDAFEIIQKTVPIGSVYVREADLDSINEELNGNPEGYDEKLLTEAVRNVLNSDYIKSCSILRSTDAVRDSVSQIITWAMDHVDNMDPRSVIQVTMDGLRQIQVLDGSFPSPLTKSSLWGLLGDFVDLAYPTTVACKEMLLYQMLPVIGASLGATYYLPYGSDKHFPSLFSLAIGRTTDGKGQAKHHIEEAMRLVEPLWFKSNVHSNPASGEGLVRMLAGNRLVSTGKNRFVIFNSEMVTTFNASARKDSTLSGHLRGAYDGDRLENFRSDHRNTTVADDYILGFCGTITPQELKDVMPAIDWKNGAANRFLWSIGFKDKQLSESSTQPDFAAWATRVSRLVELNKTINPTGIAYSKSGKETWNQWYHSLPEGNDDILSESQARAAANCARVANLYAQLDERRLDGWKLQLEPAHIEAAIEIVNRSRQSVEWYISQANLIQNSTPSAKFNQEELMKLKTAVAVAGRNTGTPELTQAEVSKLFSHKTAEERDELCILAGLRVVKRESLAGRPRTVWTWGDK